MGNRRFNIVILRDNLRRGFFANAGHAGDIIGRIPHQCLHINKFGRCHAIFRLHIRRVIILCFRASALRFGNPHLEGFPCQLQKVSVPRNHNRHNAVFLRQSGKRPQNIVRLKALLLKNRDVHGLQYLLQKGHLFAQFLRHTLSGSLVAVKGSVAEGGRMQIKRHRQIIGLLLIQKLK